MDTLAAIREKFQAGRIEFSEHAVDQSILREISVQEIRDAIAECEIIEYYPADKYGPSCLILGYTRAGRPRSRDGRPAVPAAWIHARG